MKIVEYVHAQSRLITSPACMTQCPHFTQQNYTPAVGGDSFYIKGESSDGTGHVSGSVVSAKHFRNYYTDCKLMQKVLSEYSPTSVAINSSQQ